MKQKLIQRVSWQRQQAIPPKTPDETSKIGGKFAELVGTINETDTYPTGISTRTASYPSQNTRRNFLPEGNHDKLGSIMKETDTYPTGILARTASYLLQKHPRKLQT